MKKTEVMTKLKSNKAITLIELVITIIVLLILAGVAISMLSGENGILKQAAESKIQTEEQSTVEAMKLAGITALTAGNGNVKNNNYYTTLNSELKELGYEGTITKETKFPIEDIEVKGEHFTIRESGEVVHLAWWYIGDNKDKITNGKQTLMLGDTIDYDPTEGLTKDANGVYKEYESKPEKNGYGTESQIFKLEDEEKQKLTWIVLGTDENGDILIVPTNNINDKTGYTQWLFLKGQSGVQYGVEEVNNIASLYGYGKGAKSVRTIKVDDINKLTGFNPKDIGGKRFGSDNIYEYGNKVTYSWNTITSGNVDYSGSNGKTGTLSKSYTETGFNWLDVATNTWKSNTSFTGKITTLTSKWYYYELTTTNCKNETLYNVIADPDEGDYYWLGSQYVRTDYERAAFGLYSVFGGNVDYYDLYNSYNYVNGDTLGIRPAVSLKSDITLIPNGANSWKI